MEILRDAIFTASAPQVAACSIYRKQSDLLRLWDRNFDLSFYSEMPGFPGILNTKIRLMRLIAKCITKDSLLPIYEMAEELERIALIQVSQTRRHSSNYTDEKLSILVFWLRFPLSLFNKVEGSLICPVKDLEKLEIESFRRIDAGLQVVNEAIRSMRYISATGRVPSSCVFYTRAVSIGINPEYLCEVLNTAKWSLEKYFQCYFDNKSLTRGPGIHGPGASTTLSRRCCNVVEKDSALSAIHPDLVLTSRREFPFAHLVFTRCPENKVTFVPKNFKRLRTIAIEPPLMMYYQRQFGEDIANVLKTYYGVDLKDQSRNKDLARRASHDDTLATIDLRAASDSLSSECVRWLLPEHLARKAFALRSTAGNLPDGSSLIYEKFSSMGNGLTFPLESLLFIAIVRAVVPKSQWSDCSVYGDDIICPTEHVVEITKILEFLGFSTNSEKSFVSGRFRESCGGDYFSGRRVTIPRVRDNLKDVTSIYSLINQLIVCYLEERSRTFLPSLISYLCSSLKTKYYGPFVELQDKFGRVSYPNGYIIAPSDFLPNIDYYYCQSTFVFKFKCIQSFNKPFKPPKTTLSGHPWQQVRLSHYLRDYRRYVHEPVRVSQTLPAKRTSYSETWDWLDFERIRYHLRFS